MTKTELLAAIAATLPDNAAGLITPDDLRALEVAMLEYLTGNAATFVVDSNAALAAWANNAAGDDYTNVLVKQGTWTLPGSFASGINLTTTGTKGITGQPGSKIIITGGTYGFQYTTVPTTPDYFMTGLAVEGGNYTVLYRLANIDKCNVKCTASGIAVGYCEGVRDTYAETNSSIYAAFNYCNFLTGCKGKAGSATGSAFSSCRRMLMNTCVQGVFASCYMHSSGTTDPVGDTAAGGWNYAMPA
jgi:hypothetical protein